MTCCPRGCSLGRESIDDGLRDHNGNITGLACRRCKPIDRRHTSTGQCLARCSNDERCIVTSNICCNNVSCRPGYFLTGQVEEAGRRGLRADRKSKSCHLVTTEKTINESKRVTVPALHPSIQRGTLHSYTIDMRNAI